MPLFAPEPPACPVRSAHRRGSYAPRSPRPAPAYAATPTLLYASPSGSGSTCSLSAPCSLDGAKSRVAGLAPSMAADIDVYLRAAATVCPRRSPWVRPTPAATASRSSTPPTRARSPS
jgi:hypothetical protein